MTSKLSHRTAVAELVAALVKGNRTMRELRDWTDMSDETVNAWLREFAAAGVVYVADYRKNATGCDSAVYGWVRDDESSVEVPEVSTAPASVQVRARSRLRSQRARLMSPTTVPPEVSAWQPRHDGPGAIRFTCSLCNRKALLAGCGWHFTGLERVRVCGGCKTERAVKQVEATA